jgi:hypothetical protein
MKWWLAVLPFAACGGGDDDWAGVRNPLLGYDDVAIKDAFVVRDSSGSWRFGYSEIHDPPLRFVLGFASSPDLVTFTRGDSIDQPATGGIASPDVVRAPDGTWVMTYNSHTTDENGAEPKLYYRTSTDLATWSDAHRIHIDGVDADADRLIDAALAFDAGHAYLMFKREQAANVAVSTSGSLDGPWTSLGAVTPAQLENYQLLQIDGTWHMLATTIPIHEPTLYTTTDFQAWDKVSTFAIEPQDWNTGGNVLDHEVANAAYLVDRRADTGYWNLVYAGSTDLTTFGGRGHSSLGIARSTDLMTWEPAPTR